MTSIQKDRMRPPAAMTPDVRGRFGVAARVVGAVPGGYAVAAAVSMALARWLPGPAPEAVVWGMLAGVLSYPAAVIWMFAARTAVRAWAGLAIALGLASLLAWAGGIA